MRVVTLIRGHSMRDIIVSDCVIVVGNLIMAIHVMAQQSCVIVVVNQAILLLVAGEKEKILIRRRGKVPSRFTVSIRNIIV